MTGIYWDCDGTLMNTESAYAYAWQEVLKRRNLNLPIQHFDAYVGITKTGNRHVFLLLLRRHLKIN